MRKDLTDINFVLDRSGSMAAISEATIAGFNTFIEQQKREPGEARVTLVQFDHEYQVVHNGTALPHVAPLTKDTYQPRGNTALWDAIGRTIKQTGERLAAMPENERPGKVVFVIITDGAENASKTYTGAAVATLIAHQRDKYAWQFVFLGAAEAALKAAADVGITHNFKFQATPQGAAAVYRSASAGISSYRSGDDQHIGATVANLFNPNAGKGEA